MLLSQFSLLLLTMLDNNIKQEPVRGLLGMGGGIALSKISGSSGGGATGSVQFDGDGDCLTVADNTDFEFGSGNFTLEAFINYTDTPGTGSNTYVIASKWDNQSAPNDKGFILRISDDGNGDNLQWFYTTDGSNNQITTGSTVLSPNTWYHVAFVRNGTTGTFYIDGVADSTTVSFGSDSIRDTGNAFRIGANLESGSIGQEFNGLISNVRVIKGTALYTSNFTAPTSALTNVTNTKLLCCQSTTSATAAAVTPGTITANGNVAASSSSPFSSFSGLLTRFNLTGSSLNPSTDDFSSSLLESDGSFGGSGQSQYYEIDSRTTAANRLAWEFDFSSVSSYDHFAIQFEYYWDAGDPNFKTTFAWQNNGTFAANLGSYFRTDRASSLYSGRWMGKDSTTASDTWGQTSSSWISVVGYHNINNNTGYLKFNGTKRIEGSTNADSTYTYYTSADTLSFAQFVDNAASDNGIRMRVGVIQISCWNGQESDMPAFNGRFT